MKIISSGKAIHTPEFYKKKVKARRIRLTTYFLLSTVFLAFLIFFLRLENFIISEIVVAEEIVVNREEIIQVIEAELSGHYLYLIPKSNAFVYKINNPKNRLLEQFPRFKNLHLNLEGFKKLVVSGVEHEPYALYCTEECFFLNREGLIFRKAPTFSEGVYFIYKIGDEKSLGENFLPQETFQSLTSFINNLKDLGVEATELEVGEEDYRLALESGGDIVWKKEVKLPVIYSNLEAFLNSDAIKSQADFLDKISTLDLKTENKVFYKFK